jgi:hypothetical protein
MDSDVRVNGLGIRNNWTKHRAQLQQIPVKRPKFGNGPLTSIFFRRYSIFLGRKVVEIKK